MLKRFIARLFGQPATEAASREFETLNQRAPLRDVVAEPETSAEPEAAEGFICRETILARDQRVAGYQFMLQQGTRNRISSRSRRIHHVYAEVLVRSVLKIDVARLLGHRKAFLEVPDSFLGHPSIAQLPATNSVLTISAIDDAEAPTAAELQATVRQLRRKGYRFAIDVSDAAADTHALRNEVDYLIVRASETEPWRIRDLADSLLKSGNKTAIMACNLPTRDDFAFCFGMGVALFQGPFVTRREDWTGNAIGPNAARISMLLARLRTDPDTHELAQLLQQDPALSLRLMGYINSAAIGLREEITSIERALVLLGHEKLYRWLMLLLYGAQKGSAHASVLLDSALVRARMLELLGEGKPAAQRDALFLVGLLSLVDALLQVPIDTAMASLATAPEIEAAVVRGEGPMAGLLHLAIACEGDDADRVDELAARCGIDAALARRRHTEAMAWAMEVTAERD